MNDTPLMFSTPPNVVIVDDTPANLRLLNELLLREGYQVRLFLRGMLALEAMLSEPPDLLLLDITMPEMSGYALCQR